MISRISTSNINNIQINNKSSRSSKDNLQQSNSPNFNGKFTDKFVESTIKGIQYCEKNPMLNVAVIDLATAIIPRSIFESFTNIFAGFEAFRRESSGLIINCLIPGFLALGAAKLFNNSIVGKNADLSTCWSGKDGINKITDLYKDAPSSSAYADGMARFNDPQKARVYATHYNLLSSASGVDGKEVKKFRDIAELDIASASEKLTQATFEEPKQSSFMEHLSNMGKRINGWLGRKTNPQSESTLDEVYHSVAHKTHIAETVTFGEGKKALVTDLKSAMNNSTKLLRGLVKDGAETPEQIASLAKRAKKLVNVKSGIAMGIIIPLAASAQYINRWITSKASGVKGAPIYNDYGKTNNIVKTPEQEKEEKQKLLKQKFISIGSMVGVACLSMMKLPTLSTLKNIFQFKGQFPTMDQARAISTVTFSSRMAVADDKNELSEATGRDIVTFSSMYFLGDYAAKGYASHLEHSKGVKLINRTKHVDKNANIFKKVGNWILNSHLKSTDELVGTATHSFEDMRKLRAQCQMANLGSSLLILGLIVPIYTRMKTARNHKKDLERANKVSFTSNQPLAQQNLTRISEKSKFKVFQSFKHGV